MLQKLQFNIKKQERNIFFVFLLGLLFYCALVLFFDIKKIAKVSQSFNWWLVVVLLLLSSANYLFRFFRWQYYLGVIKIHLPFATSFRIFLSGLSMTVTPGKMGEVLKAYLVKKETGNGLAHMMPLLITERLTDGIGMIILALGGIYLFRQSTLFFAFAVAMVSSFFLFVACKKRVLKLIKAFEKKYGHIKILDFFVIFFENSGKLLSRRQLFIGVLTSVVAWGFEGVSLFLLVGSFTHRFDPESLFFSFLIFSFSSIAGFLVLIPGGIGVAEGSIASLLTLFYHMDLPYALFITLIFRFSTLWYGVAVGLMNVFLSFSESS